MNFVDLTLRCPDAASLTRGRLVLGEELLIDLFAPDRRGFFRACQMWAKGGPGPDAFPGMEALLAALSPQRRRMAELHLDCAELVRSGSAGPDFYERVRMLSERAGCHPMLAGDVLAELMGPALNVSVAGTTTSGTIAKATRAVRTHSMMMAEVGDDPGWVGVATRLVVEALPAGSQGVYPAAAFAFVQLDEDFLHSVSWAWELARGKEPQAFPGAVRWSLAGWTTGEPTALPVVFTRLRGASAGGAVALAMVKLATECRDDAGPLRDVAVQNVAVLAALGEGGALLPVDCLGSKIVAALLQHVHFIVVAQGQQDLPDRFCECVDVEGFFVDIRHDLCCTRAASVDAMVQRIAANQGSRFGHIDCQLPARDSNYVGRALLMATLDQHIRIAQRGYLVLVGGIGTGKSAFLAEYLHRERVAGRRWAYHLVKEESSPDEAAQCLYDRLRRNYVIKEAADWQSLPPGRRLKLLLEEISRRLQASGRKEVFFVDAADQMRLPHDTPFLPGVLFDLPPNILAVITTNNRLDWLNTVENVTRWDMEEYLDDRLDIRTYLDRMNEEARLGLSAEFVESIFHQPAPPVFFTVEANVRQLQSAQPDKLLRSDAALWCQPPEEKIMREIGRATQSLHMSGVPREAVLFALGALAMRYEDLSQQQMCELGLLEPPHLAFAVPALASFFRPAPLTHAEQAPRSFCHPEYVRVIRRELTEAQQAECHRLWASGCVRVWRKTGHPAQSYALRCLLPHLRKAGDWDRLADFLTNFQFLGRALGMVPEGELFSASAKPAAPSHFAELLRQFEKSLRRNGLPEEHPRRKEVAAVYSALAQSAQVLKEDPQQVFQQLRNHLPPDCPAIAELNRLLEERAKPWLERLNTPAAEDESRICRQVQPAASTPRFACFLLRGRLVATGGEDGSVTVFSTSSLGEAKCLQRLGDAVAAVTRSPDGTHLAWSTGPTVVVWDAEHDRHVLRLCRDKSRIVCLAFSSQGLLATADERGVLCVHEIASRQLVRECRPHTGRVCALAFSPDGRWLASVGADYRIVLQDPATGQTVVQEEAHQSWVEGVAFSPDGQRLATGGGVVVGEVKLWQFDPSDNQLLLERTLPCLPSGVRCLTTVTNSAGDWLLACGSHCGTVRLIELTYGGAVFTCSPGAPVLSLDYAGPGNSLVSTCKNGEVKLWQLPTLRHAGAVSAKYVGWEIENTYAISLSPDGRRAVSGGRIGVARLWEVDTGKFARALASFSNPINQVTFSPVDPNQLAVSSNGEVRLLDLREERRIVLCRGHQDWVVALRFSPCGRWLVSGGEDGHVLIHDAHDGRFASSLTVGGDVVALAVTADARHLAVSTEDGLLRFFDRSAGGCAGVTIQSGPQPVTAIEFSPDGKLMAWGDASGKVSVAPLGSSTLSGAFTGHHAKINALAFSSDSQSLASGGADCELRVWRVQSRRPLAWTTCTHHVKAILFAGPPNVLHVADKGGANLVPNFYCFALREC